MQEADAQVTEISISNGAYTERETACLDTEMDFKDMEAPQTVRQQAVGLKVNKPENRSLDDINDNFANHSITIPGLSATVNASSVDLNMSKIRG